MRGLRPGLLAALLVAPWLARGAVAATAYSLDYFVTAPAGACLVDHLRDGSSWIRTYRAARLCPDQVAFQQRKGKGEFPWASETFVADRVSGFLEIVNEVRSDGASGEILGYRVFRDAVTGEKGAPWLPLRFPYRRGSTWVANVGIEEWTGSDGAPACWPVRAASAGDATLVGGVEGIGTWRAWLRDLRRISGGSGERHDVDVIRRFEMWGEGLENTEYYYYGRWRDPATGRWQGLGLVKWEWFRDGELRRATEKRYLVDCVGEALCPTCPP